MDTSIVESMRNRLAQEIEEGTAPILSQRTLAKIIKCFDELKEENERLKAENKDLKDELLDLQDVQERDFANAVYNCKLANKHYLIKINV